MSAMFRICQDLKYYSVTVTSVPTYTSCESWCLKYQEKNTVWMKPSISYKCDIRETYCLDKANDIMENIT